MATRITLRLDFEDKRLGHGKVSLLEAIGRCGSIAAAGREFGMSYRRAWLLVADVNRMFQMPLVATKGGGAGGGGAQLTALGRDIVRLYREAEQKAAASAEHEIRQIADALGRD